MLKNNKKGFTIIEVVLVLAIAGLIFLMVFLALPALQRSQRDVARKQDIANLKAAVINYLSNNKGKIIDIGRKSQYFYNVNEEGADIGFLTSYWRPNIISTIQVVPVNQGWATSVRVDGGNDGLVIHIGGRCAQLEDGTWSTTSGTQNSNRAAIYARLESVRSANNYYGEVGANYCEDF